MPLSELEDNKRIGAFKDGVLVIQNGAPSGKLNIRVENPVGILSDSNISEAAAVAVDVVTGIQADTVEDSDADGTTELVEGVAVTRARLQDITSTNMTASVVAGGKADLNEAEFPATEDSAIVVRPLGTVGTQVEVLPLAGVGGRTKISTDANGDDIGIFAPTSGGGDLEFPIIPGSVEISTSVASGAVSLMDLKGNGRLMGEKGRGTIDYETGRVTLEFTEVPTADIDADYEAVDRSATGFGMPLRIVAKYVGTVEN